VVAGHVVWRLPFSAAWQGPPAPLTLCAVAVVAVAMGCTLYGWWRGTVARWCGGIPAGQAEPVSGLGSKMGLDATHKWPGETSREWGRVIVQDEAVKRRVDELWQELGID
jgi:hypothetical protein